MSAAKKQSGSLAEITDNYDKPSETFAHTGPVRIAKNVEIFRVKKCVITKGFFYVDGDEDNEVVLQIPTLSVSDPRDQQGVPADAIHLGGVTGVLGTVTGAGLQGDFGKTGRGTHDLTIKHAIGHAVAYEDPKPKHQDGWQLMAGERITFEILDYYGGPNTNHAALFCAPNDPGRDANYDDPTLVVDCVALGGTVISKAAGIALAACTRCGAKNMHIECHYPWRIDKKLTVDPINENNTFITKTPS